MTAEFFDTQVERLKLRFGAKNFDEAFIEVVGPIVAPLTAEFFRQTVDTWIGSRKITNPPLLAEFRECQAAFGKQGLRRETERAAHVFSNGLGDVLRKTYRVDTLREAMEIEILKIRTGGSSENEGGVK